MKIDELYAIIVKSDADEIAKDGAGRPYIFQDYGDCQSMLGQLRREWGRAMKFEAITLLIGGIS